jgi:hypothetical protein
VRRLSESGDADAFGDVEIVNVLDAFSPGDRADDFAIAIVERSEEGLAAGLKFFEGFAKRRDGM